MICLIRLSRGWFSGGHMIGCLFCRFWRLGLLGFCLKSLGFARLRWLLHVNCSLESCSIICVEKQYISVSFQEVDLRIKNHQVNCSKAAMPYSVNKTDNALYITYTEHTRSRRYSTTCSNPGWLVFESRAERGSQKLTCPNQSA